jgi:hypothetical protein
MHFQESIEGSFRIYAGALEAPRGGGYIAAVVVSRVGSPPGREAWRDDSLACGHRWERPNEALHYALSEARRVIRTRLAPLAA